MTEDIHPSTPIHLSAIKTDALLAFLTRYLPMDREAVDFFAGCMKRAAEEASQTALAAGIADPGLGQASAIAAEEARQIMLTPLSPMG